METQRQGLPALLRACLWAGWLQYRTLRYYPSNLALAAVQQLTLVGVWFFTARFLGAGADQAVAAYGGNYVSYVLVGVVFNQVGLAALASPFATISEAFWDKRLEAYHQAAHGLWGNVVGRLGFGVLFATALQAVVLTGLIWTGAIAVHGPVHLGVVLLALILTMLANGGLGAIGASLFFLLEVKSGQDPVTWTYRYLIMLLSGLYVPASVLPAWLRAVGGVLPQTYTFQVTRATLLLGGGYGNGLVAGGLLGLAVSAVLAGGVGCWLLAHALRRAERAGGVGVVV